MIVLECLIIIYLALPLQAVEPNFSITGEYEKIERTE